MATILVLSPHPDDEAIGCGGTLRKHVEQGDEVHVIFLTSGENGGGAHAHPIKVGEIREAEAHAAAAILGTHQIEFWHQPDGSLEATPALVQRLAKRIAELSPVVIYLPHEQEMHVDHQATVRLLRASAPTWADQSPQPLVLMFEVWTPLQTMHHIVDITKFIDTKIEAIRAYRCQNERVSFDDAFRGLARYRGEMHCWPEGEYAEVFQRLKT